MTAPFRTIPHLSPIQAQVRELGIVTQLLLRDGPRTDAEQAIIDAAEAETGANDPTWSMM